MRISHRYRIFFIALSLPAFGQVISKLAPPPLPTDDAPQYYISFRRGEPIAGIGAMPAITLPYGCNSDGKVFISMYQTLGTGSRPANLNQYSPSLLLVSISPSGKAVSFPLNQVPDLFNVIEIDHYVSESSVIFLLRAVRGNHSDSDGYAIESGKNSLEEHLYVIVFNLDGTYRKTVQIEEDFQINYVGVFPSGVYLASGSDKTDRSPRLAMFTEDGRLLKYLQVAKGDAPLSVVGTLNNSGKGLAVYTAPRQFVGEGNSLYLVQLKSDFPILEVNESGAIRAIHPKLPKDIQIHLLIPSDVNLYARGNLKTDPFIYELDSRDGTLMRRIQVRDDPLGAASVACVNQGKFYSFEHAGEKMVPLVGTAEISPDATPAK